MHVMKISGRPVGTFPTMELAEAARALELSRNRHLKIEIAPHEAAPPAIAATVPTNLPVQPQPPTPATAIHSPIAPPPAPPPPNTPDAPAAPPVPAAPDYGAPDPHPNAEPKHTPKEQTTDAKRKR